MANTFEQWQQKAAQIRIPSQAIIDGLSQPSVSGKTFACISPIDGRELAQVADCNADDVELAVAAARRSFESGKWSNTAPKYRKKIMLRFAELIRQNAEELALLETLDMGKPIGDAMAVDVMSSANCIAWNGEAIDKIYDEIAPTGPNELGLVSREPLGVIGAIVPWNFPMMMACWKLGPALVTGNSVVLKPSEKSPLTAIRLAELVLEAGIPPGVLNVVTGFGKSAGEPIATHMDVDGLVFTGSTGVGKLLMSLAGSSNMKRAFMECGGKSPNIVFPDAPNLDKAAEAAAMGVFYNQGEVCTAASRLLVHRSIKDEFIEKVIAAGASMMPGHPLDPTTRMGAMVDQMQTERVMGYIQKGQSEGATLAAGGKRVLEITGGFYIEPTIFCDVNSKMTIACEEIIGPVLSCISFESEDEALKIANDTQYGLAAAVWTSDLGRAHRVAKKLRAGSVWVNCYDGGDMTAPFGGFKQSGNGRDKSLHALEKYTELKATWINLAP